MAVTEAVEEYGNVDGHGGDRILETETFQGRGKKAEGRKCPLLSAICPVCVRDRYFAAGGAGFAAAGAGFSAAGFAVDGAAGLAVVAAGFAASNRLMISPVMSSDGST